MPARRSAAFAVPESIQSVILSRWIGWRRGHVKHTLQSAAVIGRLFRRRLLEQVAQSDAEVQSTALVLDGALADLEDRQLIYEERAIPEEEIPSNTS